MKTVNIGGDRLGSGNKMKVALHSYERSTHDLSYIWRSSMAPGTLVPFLKQVALPGDTWDINLDALIRTIPTLGPLFGSFKFQLDVFQVPIRLYIKELHNNKLGIGMDIKQAAFPYITMMGKNVNDFLDTDPSADLSSYQINQSSLAAYMGIRSLGYNQVKNIDYAGLQINALPIIAYYDIYKNYYANKQEDKAYVIAPNGDLINPLDSLIVMPQEVNIYATPLTPATPLTSIDYMEGNLKAPLPEEYMDSIFEHIYIKIDGTNVYLNELYSNIEWISSTQFKVSILKQPYTTKDWQGYAYMHGLELNNDLYLQPFFLEKIDDLREALLDTSPVEVTNLEPISFAFEHDSITYKSNSAFSQSGLAVKTYQSDIFNNWVNDEFISGDTGINSITAISIDSETDSFTLDQFNLAKKVYNMLNRIAVSGGSYQDYLEAVYDINTYFKAETPIYCGGLSKEIVFSEVTSTADNDENPLGTLAGKGHFNDKKKGGYVVVKVDEPSYIIGIASITPRVDYSQGNEWDVMLGSLGELHVPALDGIGYQDLLSWQLHGLTQSALNVKAIGKQPAWLNYMTNYNRVYGTFAEPDNQMFMTLNRRYSTIIKSMNATDFEVEIVDATTYIDPAKFNYAFADTALDAQNFWVQIGCDIKARRKMSAKQIPNL